MVSPTAANADTVETVDHVMAPGNFTTRSFEYNDLNNCFHSFRRLFTRAINGQ